MAYTRISPDYTDRVADVARRFPAEWEAARKDTNGHRNPAFIRRCAFELHKHDANIGLNGKRGTDEISTDALSYKNATAPGGVEVIDVIVGSTHSPAWQDVTKEGVLGKYIEPTSPDGVVTPPSTPGTPGTPTTPPDPGSSLADLDDILDERIAARVQAVVSRLEARIAQLEARPVVEPVKLPTRVALRSEATGYLLCVDLDRSSDGWIIHAANREAAGQYETFALQVVE